MKRDDTEWDSMRDQRFLSGKREELRVEAAGLVEEAEGSGDAAARVSTL